MARPRGTDRDELRRVFREHADAVYAFFAYSVDAGTAEDLASATFERVVKAWRRYDARKAGERTWILAIARNILIDHYRRSAHRRTTSTDERPELLDRLTTADDFVARSLDADELRGLVSVLGEREREILALRYAADLTAAEIAGLMELSTANVQQILSRSLRRLRTRAGAQD